MKQAVKGLIKSPAAFVIVVLLVVLILLFTVRAATGNKIVSKAPTTTSVEVTLDQNLA